MIPLPITKISKSYVRHSVFLSMELDENNWTVRPFAENVANPNVLRARFRKMRPCVCVDSRLAIIVQEIVRSQPRRVPTSTSHSSGRCTFFLVVITTLSASLFTIIRFYY